MTSFIKPASPNPTTSEKDKLNTETWIHQNFVILRDHYDAVISSHLLNLPSFQLEAYNRALKWARSRYGRRLTTSSIDTLRAMTMSPPVVNSAPDDAFLVQDGDFPPLPRPVQDMPLIFQTDRLEQVNTAPLTDKEGSNAPDPKPARTVVATVEVCPPSPKPQRFPRTSTSRQALEEKETASLLTSSSVTI